MKLTGGQFAQRQRTMRINFVKIKLFVYNHFPHFDLGALSPKSPVKFDKKCAKLAKILKIEAMFFINVKFYGR